MQNNILMERKKGRKYEISTEKTDFLQNTWDLCLFHFVLRQNHGICVFVDDFIVEFSENSDLAGKILFRTALFTGRNSLKIKFAGKGKLWTGSFALPQNDKGKIWRIVHTSFGEE